MPSDLTQRIQTLNKESEALRLQQPERALELAIEAERLAREQGDSKALAESLLNIGAACWRLERHSKGKQAISEAITIFTSLDDVRGKTTAYQILGHLHREMNEMNDALLAHQESLRWAEAIGEKKSIADQLNNIATLYGMFADYNKALELFLKSLAVRQEIGERYGEASTRNNIGLVYKLNHEYENALKEYQASLSIFESLNLKKEASMVLGNLGTIFDRLNDPERAIMHHEKSLNLYEEVNSQSGIAITKHNLAIVYEGIGAREKALKLFSEALALGERLANKVVMANACLSLGRLYANQKLN